MGDVAKELTSGNVGGVAQFICGLPFDTIKVKLQIQPSPLPGQLLKYAGAMDVVKNNNNKWYKGFVQSYGVPLATLFSLSVILFITRGRMKALFYSEPVAPLMVNQQVVCGVEDRLVISILACHIEFIKCFLQDQSELEYMGVEGGLERYEGPLYVVGHVLGLGGLRGLFKELVPTMSREVPINAIMFGSYEALKQYFFGGPDTSKLGRGSLIVARGLFGVSFWILVYLTDVSKSVIQIHNFKYPKFTGSVGDFKNILAAEGIKRMYTNFGHVMTRGVQAMLHAFWCLR